MYFRSVLFALGAWTLSAPAFSQADAARNASAKEIEGYWQLLPLPDQLEPKELHSNPWPAQCQWFSYGSDGQMKSFDQLRGPCDSPSKAQLEQLFSAIPAVISWQYDLSPVYHKGALIIKRSDVKDYGEIWEPQIVVKPFTRGGVEFHTGDLLLYLADLQSHKIVWIRHLRKAGEKADDVSSVAGVYSSAHTITLDGAKFDTSGYVEIDRTGRISAFERQGEGPDSAGSGCYVPASGTATNAGLQGRMLTPGVSPMGAPVFQTLAGDSDVFGILAEPGANGNMRWFFHWGKPNSTATIVGSHNLVNASHQATYSISGPALTSPTPDQLQSMLCRQD
jgi:hypothetical protein